MLHVPVEASYVPLCSLFPKSKPKEQPDPTSGTGSSGDPVVTAVRASDQPAPVSKTPHKKTTSREKQQDEIPLGILLDGSTWVASSEFQNLPVIDLSGKDNPPAAPPQDTSTPIKATPVTGR